MKQLVKIECNTHTEKTNLKNHKTCLGCARVNYDNISWIKYMYYLAKLDDSIKYIRFKGVKDFYLFRRKDMFISTKKSFPHTMNKSNTMLKVLNR